MQRARNRTIDLTKPGHDPIRAIANRRRDGPGGVVIVSTGVEHSIHRDQAVLADAAAFVDKLDDPLDILETMRPLAGAIAANPCANGIESRA